MLGRSLLLPLLLFVAAACIGGAKQEVRTVTVSPSPFSPNGVSIPTRWPENTVAITGTGMALRHSTEIDQSFTPADEVGGLDPVELMLTEWNDALADKKFFTVPVTSTVSNKEHSALASYNDNELGIYIHNSWFAESVASSSALAITLFFGVRKNANTSDEYIEMTHADIIFNYRDFDFTTDENDNSRYDFQTVLLHELGHFIGLGHNTSTVNSVMYPFLTSSDVNRSIFAADITNLELNYDISGSSSLTATGYSAGAMQDSSSPSSREGEVVQGVIELRADGSCHHRLNGETVLVH